MSKEELKTQNMLRFIEATGALIDREGIDKISVRKIAEQAGFHNSTIYLYFTDLEQLILLSSVKYFDEYSKALAIYSAKNISTVDTFFDIWEAFGRTVFNRPKIFYNFFFGKYSNNLTPIFKQYYELYSTEKNKYSQTIEAMFYGQNLKERCLSIMKPLLYIDGIKINRNNIELANDIIISVLKDLLEQKCKHPDLDTSDLNIKMLETLNFIVCK